jgi:hypothetical protein
MTCAHEFSTVDLVLHSGAETLGVDAFALSLIKAERQARKVFTYLVYQFPVFGRSDVRGLRRALAANRLVDFEGVLAGVDALSPVSVRDLVGQEYDRLRPRFAAFRRYRNKIFHGQVTAEGLRRQYFLDAVEDIKAWCGTFGAGAMREFGYDGFGRNSFRKSELPDMSQRFRIQIQSLEEYACFISSHMQRPGAPQRTEESGVVRPIGS